MQVTLSFFVWPETTSAVIPYHHDTIMNDCISVMPFVLPATDLTFAAFIAHDM